MNLHACAFLHELHKAKTLAGSTAGDREQRNGNGRLDSRVCVCVFFNYPPGRTTAVC